MSEVHKIIRASNFDKAKKRMLLVLIALIVLTPFISTPTVRSEPEIYIDVPSQVLVAGVVNTITFPILNDGDSIAQEVTATITIPPWMMFVDGDGNWNLTDLGAGDSKNVIANIYISPASAGNLASITVRVTYASGGTTHVQTKNIGFSVAAADFNGAYLNPYFSTFHFQVSQNNSVILIIENQGGREATNISISIGAPSEVGQSLEGLDLGGSGLSSEDLEAYTSKESTSISQEGMQFLIYNYTARWNFNSLPANGTINIPLTIFAMPSAEGSISKFPITLSYTDGFTYTQVTRYAIVVVEGLAEIFTIGSSTFPSIITLGRTFSASINLINLGTSTAQGMQVFPVSNVNITSMSSERIFLGDVEINVPTSFSIRYVANNLTNGTYHLTIPYTYKTSLGIWVNESLTVPLKFIVTEGSETQETAATPPGIEGYLIVGVGVLVTVLVVVVLATRLALIRRKKM